MGDSNREIYNNLVFLLRKFNCKQTFFMNFFFNFPIIVIVWIKPQYFNSIWALEGGVFIIGSRISSIGGKCK